MTLVYILVAILLFGILVVVHEFGHYLTARLCGIEVKEYAIGMGPKLISKTLRSGTAFSLRLFPVGGFCAFYAEDALSEDSPDDPRSFAKQPVWKRILTVLMGPGMNFLLAFLVLFFFFSISGVTSVGSVLPYVSSVEAGGPAEKAGMLAGDIIEEVDGLYVLDGTTETLLQSIAAYTPEHDALHFVIRRGDEHLQMDVKPFLDETSGRYRVGISITGQILTYDTQPVSVLTALRYAWEDCLDAGKAVLTALRALISTGEGLDQTSGPVGIVSMVSSGVKTGGLNAFLNYLVIISINLGLMNLLPIPGLDGSRFLLLCLEGIRRKPLPQKAEAIVTICGMVFLIGVMIFFTYQDILRLF